ncbi:MAG: hypothetical protein Q9210_004870 [Variospora velana]
MGSLQQCLRPPLHLVQSGTSTATASYCRFYSIARILERTEARANNKIVSSEHSHQIRLETLKGSGRELYPRFPHDATQRMSCKSFLKGYNYLAPSETVEGKELSLQGSKLAFIDLTQGTDCVQALCNQATITEFAPASQQFSGASLMQFRTLFRQIRRGDLFSIKGKPHRTERGQLSILVTELPQLISPCLHDLPTDLQNKEFRIRNRHVDLQVNRRAADTLRLRSSIICEIRNFLWSYGYSEVQTPILANTAGGAVARAFATTAVEFADRHIELRTAPEIWLKRLVLGGFEKIFELGPCFRNEGIDKTHNPEFTTCEFYAAYKGLRGLITTTERLLTRLATTTNELIKGPLKSLPPCEIDFARPFRRLDFIKELESAMNYKFPDLAHENSEAEVTKMFKQRQIRLPEHRTLPTLLDRLSAEYLEPLCQGPTWIVHHPECLAPLSKSFVDPETQQRVSARAELFVGGKELVNTYEEENSPFEQRRKFQQQAKYRDEDSGKGTEIDESYLEALEWGLPPTGGWGCGIDRLVMLLSGTDRINDVLPFGNLRNVVSLGSVRRDTAGSVEASP